MDWLQLHSAIFQITSKPIYMAHPHIIRELKGGGHILGGAEPIGG